MNKRKKLSLICGLLLVTVSVLSSLNMPVVRAEEGEEKEEKKTVTIEVSTEEELAGIAEQCHDDAWSYDKTILLKNDLYLSDGFTGIPYFNGVFDGNGYTIRNYKYVDDCSIGGFINEIGKEGLIRNLTLEVYIRTEEETKCIGAVAGINAGTIQNCMVYGHIMANSEVGGIVGINQPGGLIRGADNYAQISGFYYTGGIAGKNYGVIDNCSNKGNVNSTESWIEMEDENTDSSLIGNVDTTGLISVHSGVDTGGIAGFSEGLIARSQNDATVGYEHAGYNVGGVAGRQSGIIFSSYNAGYVYGKKDVGGIIGQQEPFIEVDQGKSIRYATDKLAADVDQLIEDAEAAEDSLSADLHALKISSDSLKDSVNKITQNVSDSKESADADLQERSDGLQERIDGLQEKGEEIQTTINSNKEEIEISIETEDLKKGAEERYQNLKGKKEDALQENENWKNDLTSLTTNLNAMSDVLDRIERNAGKNSDKISRDVENVNDSLDSTYGLMTDIKNGLEEEGASYLFTDLSEEALELDLTGRTFNCVNKGVVKGDIDVGGVVGAMAVDDENLESNQIVTLGIKTGEAYSTVNVVRHCTNEGYVTSRKDKIGGIAGYLEQGVIYDCRGFGEVNAEERNYVGGICGLSEGSIRNGYVLCSLTGNSYVGGIAGSAVKITDCVSMPLMKTTGDNTGAVAGEIPRDKLTKENDFSAVHGNVFVSDDHYGIDKVNYADIAEKVEYKELCAMDGLPKEFKHLTIAFRIEDETVLKEEYSYGEDLSGITCPELEGKEGHFVSWPDLSGQKMLGNMVVEAEYLQNITVIPSEIKDDDRVVAFVGGQFNIEDQIAVTPVSQNEVAAKIPEVADAKGFRAYRVEVLESRQTEEGRKNGDFSYAIRLYNPFEHYSVWEIRGEGGEVRKPDVNERGRYLAVALPENGATYVIVQTENPLYRILIIAGAALAVVIVAVVIVIITRHGKKKNNAESTAN